MKAPPITRGFGGVTFMRVTVDQRDHRTMRPLSAKPSRREALQRNAQLQPQADAPPIILDIASQIRSDTAFGQDAAEAARPRRHFDCGTANFIPFELEVVLTDVPPYANGTSREG